MKEATLLSAELAYLLSLMKVETAIGIDTERMFPEVPEDQGRVFQAGYDALKQHKWITTNKKSGKDSLSDELMAMVEVVARPWIVITTEIREHPQAPPKRLVHYLADHLIVEQSFLGATGYRLTQIEDLSLALLRINRAIGMPEKNRVGDHAAKMNGPVFAKIKSLVETGDMAKALPALKKLKLSETAAQAALLSMAQPRTCGTITILELTGTRIDDLNAFAYFIGDGGGWAAVKAEPDSKDLILRTIDDASMWGLVAGFVGDLMRT